MTGGKKVHKDKTADAVMGSVGKDDELAAKMREREALRRRIDAQRNAVIVARQTPEGAA